MIDEQKLNKKLAEWVGMAHIHYVTPINFTESLDECFKWLVPWGEIEEITFMFSSNAVSCDVEAGFKFYEGHVNVDSFKEAQKKSALALCLAIEKLIDGEKK